ncbi:MAG: OmpA family protein [Verrucomicrobiales bacterium]
MSAKKPSPVASLIVLLLVVLLLGGIGGGGFWAYNKWMKKSDNGETPPRPTPPVAKTDEVTEPDETGIVVIDEPSGTVAIDEPTDTDTPPPPVVVDIDTPPTTVDIDPAPATDTPPPPPAKVDDKPTEVVIENTPDLPNRPETPGTIGYATDSPQGQGLITDALQRVDEAPGKSDKEKERAKKVLREAKKISKVATVYFSHEGDKVVAAEAARLTEALGQPEVRGMTRNNKAICFALGFADKTGSASYNKALSMKRAQSVISELEKQGLKLSTTAIAIGPSELVDKENQGKNRAAEVWIIIP